MSVISGNIYRVIGNLLAKHVWARCVGFYGVKDPFFSQIPLSLDFNHLCFTSKKMMARISAKKVEDFMCIRRPNGL